MQVSQETGKVVWYSHLFKIFVQFVVIHTIKSFSVLNEAEVDAILESPCLFYDPMVVGLWVPLPFLNPVCTYGSSWFTYC